MSDICMRQMVRLGDGSSVLNTYFNVVCSITAKMSYSVLVYQLCYTELDMKNKFKVRRNVESSSGGAYSSHLVLQ